MTPTLWDQPPVRVERVLKVFAKRRKPLLDCLEPFVREVGLKAGRDGFTMDNVKRAAGLMQNTHDRRLSYLGLLPRYFGLRATGERRYNDMGNPQTVWVLPEVG